MVFSIFNEDYRINDRTVIYNHLSKQIVKFEDIHIENLKSIDSYNFNQHDINDLKNRGIIVDSNVDEELLAELKFNDYIYNNTLRLVLLPSEDCNFRCKFCYENFGEAKSSMSDETINALIKFIRKNITKFSGLSIDWFGGEPLLAYQEIVEFSQKAKDICAMAKVPYNAMMTTNAYLLDAAMLELMLGCNVTSFHVTLCGFQETHDSIRHLENGGGTFQRIISNLISIRDSVSRKSFKIMIRINVTKETLKTLDKFVLYLDTLFAGDERFTFYFRPIGDWGGEQVKGIVNDLGVTKNDIFEKVMSTKNTLNFDAYYNLLNSNICAASMRNNYVIRANGDINKCTESLYTSYNYVGKLMDSGNMNIDTYKLARWLYFNNIDTHCKSCKKFKLCKNRKCPDNNLKTDKYSSKYCGYEDLSIVEILTLLCDSQSKYVFSITSKTHRKD